MNIIDQLRKKLREDPWQAAREGAEGSSPDLVAGYVNMTKGYRQGLLTALEALGCDPSAETLAYWQEQHDQKAGR